MKKIVLFLLTALSAMGQQKTYSIKNPLVLETVNAGQKSDSILVQGADGQVKKVPRSGFTTPSPTLQQVVQAGNHVSLENASEGIKFERADGNQTVEIGVGEPMGVAVRGFGQNANLFPDGLSLVEGNNTTVLRQGVMIGQNSGINNTTNLYLNDGTLPDTARDFHLPDKPSGSYTLATTSDVTLQKIIDEEGGDVTGENRFISFKQFGGELYVGGGSNPYSSIRIIKHNLDYFPSTAYDSDLYIGADFLNFRTRNGLSNSDNFHVNNGNLYFDRSVDSKTNAVTLDFTNGWEDSSNVTFKFPQVVDGVHTLATEEAFVGLAQEVAKIKPYKVHTFIMKQEDTNDPTEEVLFENTLNEPLTWVRESQGLYKCTSGEFTDRTVAFLTNVLPVNETFDSGYHYDKLSHTLRVRVQSSGGGYIDLYDDSRKILVEIRTYPIPPPFLITASLPNGGNTSPVYVSNVDAHVKVTSYSQDHYITVVAGVPFTDVISGQAIMNTGYPTEVTFLNIDTNQVSSFPSGYSY